MARDEPQPPRDHERKRSGNAAPRAAARAAAWTPRRGRSGYGVDSIRPHLREQLERQKLLRPTFPPEEPEDDPG